jgi:diaminohydroxyphosphoribosylaminopyrimidine deaminase/5-amino-6-(5-phosphoribosylamino)uracil reductase
MRSRYDAVMAGSSTVKADNAELTVRLCGGRQPLRVVLDRNLELPLDAKVFNSEAVTIVFASDHCDPKKAGMLRKAGVEVYPVPETSGSLDLRRVLLELHRLGVQSVLVEGGSRLSAAFAGSGLADKLYVFVAAKFFGGDGLSALAPIGIVHPEEAVRLRIDHSMHYGSDLLIEAYFQ